MGLAACKTLAKQCVLFEAALKERRARGSVGGFLMYITDSVGEGPLREGTRTIGEIDFAL